MSYVSGSRTALLNMLEDAFAARFEAGFHCEDNPGDYRDEWLGYYYEVLHKELGEEWIDE